MTRSEEIVSDNPPLRDFPLFDVVEPQHVRPGIAALLTLLDLKIAEELLEELRVASWKAAVQDMEDLKAFSKSQGAEEAVELTHLDLTFWSERLRESKYEINEVMDGLFSLAKMLFGIDVVAADGFAPVWNKDVTFYQGKDSSGSRSPVAYLYFDTYTRPSEKFGGAWIDEVVTRIRVITRDGITPILPIAHKVCNQTPPVGSKPSLMTFDEQ